MLSILESKTLQARRLSRYPRRCHGKASATMTKRGNSSHCSFSSLIDVNQQAGLIQLIDVMIPHVAMLVASPLVLMAILGKASVQALVSRSESSNTHYPACIILTKELGPSTTKSCKHASNISSISSRGATQRELHPFNSSNMSSSIAHPLGNVRRNVTVTVTPYATPDPYIHEAHGRYYLVGIPSIALHRVFQGRY